MIKKPAKDVKKKNKFPPKKILDIFIKIPPPFFGLQSKKIADKAVIKNAKIIFDSKLSLKF